MTGSMGTLDFFLLEAGEYLERLDAFAQSPAGTPPAIDDFVRLARAFRGSAIMASQHGMGRAAQGLESVARALREGRLQWNEQSRGEVVRAIDDCKVLMRRLRSPEQGDTEKAEAIGVRLDRLSGRASAAMRAATGPGLDAGGRAFVAREASAIASVLQNVARALRANPAGREILQGVGPAMSALRGVAVLNDLPPLGELLAAVEAAVKDPEANSDVFEDAGKALARAAREVVDKGRPEMDSTEAQAFAARLFGTIGAGIVPVETLFYDDAGPHVLSQGRAPTPASWGRVEMVSQGEYLTAAATELSKAEGLQRDLRLYTIAANLRPVVSAGGGPMPNALSRLAVAAREAIGRGTASYAATEFAGQLRNAAAALSAAQSGDETQLANQLSAAADAINALAERRKTPVVPVRRASAEKPQPAEPAARAEAALPAAAPVMGEADLAASYLTLEQLINERGMPLGTIDELLQPAIGGRQSATGQDEVPVESLLYRGDAALRRIIELKPDLVAAAGTPGPRLHALINEVLDLVELGLTR